MKFIIPAGTEIKRYSTTSTSRELDEFAELKTQSIVTDREVVYNETDMRPSELRNVHKNISNSYCHFYLPKEAKPWTYIEVLRKSVTVEE